jgi:PIN domain nuclease of toxin-antitoxin system
LRVLLDTHTLIWWVLDSNKLSKAARQTITDFGNEVFVSAASAWDISTKFRLGKLPEAEPLVGSFTDSVRILNFSELPVSIEHGARAGLPIGDHKDPFDRILMAQSLSEGFPPVSNEQIFDSYHIHRIW